MTCLDKATLSALVAGRLPDAQRADAEAHLSTCATCTAAAEALRRAPATRDIAVAKAEAATRDLHGPPGQMGELTSPHAAVEKIGPYTLLERLGQGGMGAVYTAYDPELDRRVALKLLRPEALGSEGAASAQARLLREAQAMAKLAHPNVVAVYSAGTYQQKVYLVMERVEGATLKDWLIQAPRSQKEILDAFLQAGRGLAAAHATGLVHRDFKPSNVLVGKDGRVRVTDFGLARPAGDASPEVTTPSSPEDSTVADMAPLATPITRAGAVVGTPAYMAPEQFVGRSADARTDQFAFAVALYEALYGERPFERAFDPIHHPAVRAPPPGKHVPPYVRDALLKALSIAAEQRFTSLEALLDTLANDPAVARRKGLVVGGAVGLVVLTACSVGMAFYLARHRRADECSSPTPLAGVWDDAQSRALEAAFLATGEKLAAVSAKGTVRALDEFANSWTFEQRAACEKATANRDDETALLERTCLSRQKTQLQALVEVLMHPDRDTVASALNAASSLLPPSRCADPHVLATLPPAPQDPKVRNEVEALRVKIAAANAQSQAGRPKQAVATLTPVVERARALGYRPLLAEALISLGEVQDNADQPLAAGKTLEEGERTAEVAGMDVAAAEASAMAAFIIGYESGHMAEAKTWLERARTELERGGGDPLAESYAENAAGILASIAGGEREGLQHVLHAYALREKVLGPNHPKTLGYLLNVGVQYTANCQYPEVVSTYEKVLAKQQSVLGDDHPQVGNTLAELAAVFVLTGRFDEADAHLDRAMDLSVRYTGTESWWTADVLEKRAVLRLAQARFREALDLSTKADAAGAKSTGPDSTMCAVTRQTRGQALLELGSPREALPLLERSIEMLEKAEGVNSVDLVDSLEGASVAHVALREPEKALPLAERAMEIVDKHCARPGQKARVRFALARALMASHKEKARVTQLAHQAREELQGIPWAKWRLDELVAWMNSQKIR